MKVVSAKVVKEDVSKYIYNMPLSVFIRIVVLGVMIGVFTWLIGLALDRYMLVPFFCNEGENVSICANSTVISSNIAIVLVAVMAVPLLATAYARRALVVVAAAVVALWGTSAWVAGAWHVSLLWTALSFAAVYAALSWINRLRSTVLVIVLIVLFVVATRLVLSFA